MLRDYLLPPPAGLDTYRLHQWLEAQCEGRSRLLWRLDDDGLRVRTDAALPASLPGADTGTPLPAVRPGLYLFELSAAVAYKKDNATRYYPSDRRAERAAWFDRQAARYGFEVLSVHIRARKDVVERGERGFAIDDTRFTGVLRVVDAARFAPALADGIGRAGKAFGRGLLTLDPID